MTASALRAQNLSKIYPDQDGYALGDAERGVSFEVKRGELFALLGPSGCGKTTTLRIVGGFVPPTSGRVEINGVDVTDQPPYARPTNTVFQSYALFPHMSLGANVAFGLKMARVSRREQAERTAKALELVGLGGMEKRKISELSGGMQQRAALARAIVMQPEVLLLDEPFGALDLKLRQRMQDELVQLKRSMGTTFVHVTHDQEEACAIADRIAVMNEGHIVQVDSPLELYRAPRTTYVAGFIDAGTIIRGPARVQGDVVELTHPQVLVRGSAPSMNGNTALAAVLPHDRIKAAAGRTQSSGDGGSVVCRMDRLIFTGSVFHLYARVSDEMEIRAALSPEEMAAGDIESLNPGDEVTLSWRPDDVLFVVDDAPTPA